MAIDITNFLNQDDCKDWTKNKFLYNEKWICATDRYIFMMQPFDKKTDTHYDVYNDETHFYTKAVIKEILKITEWFDLPKIDYPKYNVCDSCDDFGKSYVEICPGCDLEYLKKGGDKTCPVCKGSKCATSMCEAKVAGLSVDMRYLKLIDFNDTQIVTNKEKMLLFKNGNQLGAIMG